MSSAMSAPQSAVCFAPAQQGDLRPAFQGQRLHSSRACRRQSAQRVSVMVYAIKDGATLDRCAASLTYELRSPFAYESALPYPACMGAP